MLTMEYGVVVAHRPLTPTVLVRFQLLLPKNHRFFDDFFINCALR